MKYRKIMVSLSAAAFLAGSALQAGFGGDIQGGSKGAGGHAEFGFGHRGGYVCIEGFTPIGGGSLALSFGSAAGCGTEDFDFYYKSFGGFIEGTGEVSSPNFKAGQDDIYDDGFWYREGPFSSSVYYGDPENGGKRYSDDPNGAWPAWTWGHPEADPFVSADGPGDNLGGSAGMGLGGFGVGDGSKIKAGDDAYFYPLQFLGIDNFVNSSYGTYASKVSWNVVLYDRNHNEVFKKNYSTTAYYWETINYQRASSGLICPRSSVDAGEVVNDTAYAKAVKDNIFSWWPQSGMDIDFVGDGKQDTRACADAIKLKDQSVSDTFTVSPDPHRFAHGHSYGHDYRFRFGHRGGRKYELTFDGPYIYDETVDGCPALNEEGLPDTTTKWPASCFKKVDTLWADEGGVTRAFMRMTLKEVTLDDRPCHIRDHIPHLEGSMEQKAQKMMKNMLRKSDMTLDEVKRSVKDAPTCDRSDLHG